MDTPATINGEAVRLLTNARYGWNHLVKGFQRKRRIGNETTEQYLKSPHIVSFEELEDHNLVDRRLGEEQPTMSERHAGLKWLAGLIKEHSKS